MATIRKRGDAWQVMVRKVGHPLQTATFNTKAEAERWATATEASINSGVSPDKPERGFTVADLFRKYLEDVVPAKKGARWERVRINRLIETAHFTRKQLAKLGPADLQAWRDTRLKEVSGETVNRELNQISAIFTHARKEWRMGVVNPVQEVKRPKTNPARTRRPTDAETRRLLKHFRFDRAVAPTSAFEYMGWIIELAQHVPMRRGEWCSVLWEDVHLDEQWLHLRDTKNGEARDVPLSRHACELLGALPRSDERVFPVNPDTMTCYFGQACKELDIDNLHIHDYKHEATSRIAEVAKDALELSAYTGHKDLKALKRYYNPRASDLAKKLG